MVYPDAIDAGRVDIAIVGGGPAGSTLARRLASRYSCIILERGGPKCCGGLLDPDAQGSLAAMGLGLPASVLVNPQMFAVRAMDLDSGLERWYRRHYVNVDRARLDAWLLSLAAPTCAIEQGAAYYSHQADETGVDVFWHRGGQRYRTRARLLVGADGAASRVRRAAFGPPPAKSAYLAIQEWYTSPAEETAWYGAIFSRSVSDFYSWTIPKDGLIALGSALRPGPGASSRFTALSEALRGKGILAGSPVRREAAVLLRPRLGSSPFLGDDRVALCGEAAGFISPSSAEGLSYAMNSACALADALQEGLDGWKARYRKASAGLKRNISLKTLKVPILYQPLPRRLAMGSGLGCLRMATKASPAGA